MNCEQVQDLVPAYVLGNATDEERRAVEEHLAGCARHDLASARAVALILNASVDEMAPPSALKSRVMAATRGGSFDSAASDAEVRVPGWFRGRYAVAALLLAVVGALVIWNVLLQISEPPERFVHFYRGNDGDWIRIEAVLGQPGADVSLGGLASLDETTRYQLWTTRGEDVLPVQAFDTSDEGLWSGNVSFTFEAGDRIWITVEPAEGSAEPTGEAVLRSRF